MLGPTAASLAGKSRYSIYSIKAQDCGNPLNSVILCDRIYRNERISPLLLKDCQFPYLDSSVKRTQFSCVLSSTIHSAC